jgi:soluble lytic murein transglycosylase
MAARRARNSGRRPVAVGFPDAILAAMAYPALLFRTRITAFAAACLASVAMTNAHAQAAPSATDGLLDAARAAVQSGNWDIVRSLIPQVQGNVLQAYPEYWWLRQQLNDPRQDPPVGELQSFITRYHGTYLAERLRYDWLLASSRTGDHAMVLQLADTTVNSPQTACAVLLAQYSIGTRSVTARDAAAAFRPGENCWALYDQLAADGVMQWDDFVPQLRAMVESNAVTNAKRLARYMFPAQQQKVFAAVLDQPMIWLVKQGAMPHDREGRELAVIALARLARGDYQAGYDYFSRNWAGQLRPADAAWVRNEFALAAAYKLDPIAVSWYKAGEKGAPPLSDENAAWRVRAALRLQPADWRTVVGFIDQMPDKLRAEPAWVYWRSRGLVALGSVPDGQEGFRSIAGQFNFYGQLAAEELGINTTIPTAAAPVTPDELAKAQYNPALQRAIALLRLGWRAEGRANGVSRWTA